MFLISNDRERRFSVLDRRLDVIYFSSKICDPISWNIRIDSESISRDMFLVSRPLRFRYRVIQVKLVLYNFILFFWRVTYPFLLRDIVQKNLGRIQKQIIERYFIFLIDQKSIGKNNFASQILISLIQRFHEIHVRHRLQIEQEIFESVNFSKHIELNVWIQSH